MLHRNRLDPLPPHSATWAGRAGNTLTGFKLETWTTGIVCMTSRNLQSYCMIATFISNTKRSMPHVCQFPRISNFEAIQIEPYLRSTVYLQKIVICMMLISSILDCDHQSVIHHRSCTLELALNIVPLTPWVSIAWFGTP